MAILSYGMFSLPPRRMWQIAAFTQAVLRGTMLGAAQWAPERDDPRTGLARGARAQQGRTGLTSD